MMSFDNIKNEISKYNGKLELVTERRCIMRGSVEAGKFNKDILGYSIKDKLDVTYDNGDIIWKLDLPKKKLFEIEEQLKKEQEFDGKHKKDIERMHREEREERIDQKIKDIQHGINNGTY